MKIQIFFLQPLAIRYRNTEEQHIKVDLHVPYVVFLYMYACTQLIYKRRKIPLICR